MPIQNTGAGVLYAATLAEANARIAAGGYNILQTEAVFLKGILANDNQGGFFTIETGLTADGIDVLAMEASGYFLRRQNNFGTYGEVKVTTANAVGTITAGASRQWNEATSPLFTAGGLLGWAPQVASPNNGVLLRSSRLTRRIQMVVSAGLSHNQAGPIDLGLALFYNGATDLTSVRRLTVPNGEVVQFHTMVTANIAFGIAVVPRLFNYSGVTITITPNAGSTLSVFDIGAQV